MHLLEVQDLTLRFGGLTAVNEVRFSVDQGEIVSVIGPNGAGKTSLFNVITGMYEPAAGSVTLNGSELRNEFSMQVVVGILIVAMVSACGLVLAVNIQSIWDVVISQLFVYQQPFPWNKSAPAFMEYMRSAPLHDTALPFALGFLLGGLGSATIWNRSRRTPDLVARSAVSRTFQNIRLFPQMTVLENVLLGMDSRLQETLLEAAFRLPRHFSEQRRAVHEAFTLLEFVCLQGVVNDLAMNLPYGSQRRLEIARALASNPILILLDEPAAGMNPSEARELISLIRKIRERGITVLLIEHHMKVVMEISDRVVVLDYGNKIAEGAPEEVRSNVRVIEAYLGKRGAHA